MFNRFFPIILIVLMVNATIAVTGVHLNKNWLQNGSGFTSWLPSGLTYTGLDSNDLNFSTTTSNNVVTSPFPTFLELPALVGSTLTTFMGPVLRFVVDILFGVVIVLDLIIPSDGAFMIIKFPIVAGVGFISVIGILYLIGTIISFFRGGSG